MFKTRRQKRYESLRKAGFLSVEAKTLSRIPFAVPYMRPLMRERAKELSEVREEEWTIRMWDRMVRKRYRDNGWLDDKGRVSAFAMLRDFEHAYRAKHPNYDSPWQKRRGRMRNFISTFEKKLAERPAVLQPMSQATRDRTEAARKEQEAHFKGIRARQSS